MLTDERKCHVVDTIAEICRRHAARAEVGR